MALITKLPAFGCGAAIAILALACLQDVRAQSTARLAIYGCADAAGTLRLAEPGVRCKSGERRILLRPPEIKKEPKCEEDDGRAAALERRIKDLEYRSRRGTLRGTRVVAPFEVVTKKGGRLMYIEEQNVTFYNRAGKPVVWIMANDSGGYLLTQSAAATSSVGIGVLDKRAHLLVQENDRDRVEVGRRAHGRYSLQVSGPEGKMVAGIGESEAGSGIVVVADTDGSPKATMFLPFGVAGQVKVSNSQGTDVGFLATSEGGAGLLQLTDASGTLMVEAGVTKEGRGVVRAGPAMRNSGVGIVGLVPSYIIGKAN